MLESLTSKLINLIDSKPILDSDLAAASRFVLDTVACVIGGQNSVPGNILKDWFNGADRGTGSDVFLASGLAHILEIDDLHRDSVVHPGCVVIPLAWHLSARLGKSGREFLEAVLHGYEAVTRIGMAVGPAHYKVWHNTSTCGPFGAAITASKLLGLNHEQTVWALGNAGTQSCGLWQFLPDEAMSKHLHTARAAEAGYTAATLAARGFTGAEFILEGKQGFFRALCPDAKPEAVLAAPKAPWQLTQTSIKPWPCCRHTHPAIDAALELHSSIDQQLSYKVDVETFQAALDVCNRPLPQTAYTAKFSLQHCVNIALVDGVVDFESFNESQRTRLSKASANTSVRATPEYSDAFPERWGATVRVTSPSGDVITATRKDCKGDPQSPLSPQEIELKAQMVLSNAAPAKTSRNLISQVLSLSDAQKMPVFPLSTLGEIH
jgi:2-methylcitrate dehydratase PrpD